MQAAMSVTKCLTLLAMVLAIALGGHAITADTTNSSKEKQLVSLGSMPSSPSSVPDKGSKLRSLRTRDTTSAETAEEREGGTLKTALKKALNVVVEVLKGSRPHKYERLHSERTDSLYTSLLDVKIEHAHEISRTSSSDTKISSADLAPKDVNLLPEDQPKIWHDKNMLPSVVKKQIGDVSSGRAKTLYDQFMDMFKERDTRILAKFEEWHNNNLDSIASKVEEIFHTKNDVTKFYDAAYAFYRLDQKAIAEEAARKKALEKLAAKEKQPDELVRVADRMYKTLADVDADRTRDFTAAMNRENAS